MKLLVVEDDRKLSRFLVRVLSEEGHVADVCTSGEDALVHIRATRYDLVVLDWMIRGMDGLELCRELRRSGCMVPILMLTARSELAERVLALKTGVDDYLVKPFEIDELLARVTALLRRSAAHQLITVGALAIDRAERKATVAGATLDLSAREFDLLVYLVAHANQVVTRSKILADVWWSQSDSQSNLVDVHVSHLRDTLGDYAWMIETVRGRGYMLRSDRRE